MSSIIIIIIIITSKDHNYNHHHLYLITYSIKHLFSSFHLSFHPLPIPIPHPPLPPPPLFPLIYPPKAHPIPLPDHLLFHPRLV